MVVLLRVNDYIIKKSNLIIWYLRFQKNGCIKKYVSQSLFRSVMPTGYLIAYITHDQDKSILTYYPMVSV